MFSPCHSENSYNKYTRLRGGVLKFKETGFDVYIVH